MKTRLLLLVVAAPAAVLFVIACSDATTAFPSDPSSETDPNRPPRGDGSSGEEPDDEEDGDDAGKDAGGKTDSAPPCTGTPATLVAPNLDGPLACGALAFGKPAAAFVGVDAGSDSGAGGGTIPPGIYDVIVAERLSGNAGSWRETIVVGADGRFTRTRQIGTGSLGPMTYRSGTLTTSSSGLTFTEDCYVSGDAAANPGTTTLPYEVTTDACGEPTLQYQATGFRFTLVPRLAE